MLLCPLLGDVVVEVCETVLARFMIIRTSANQEPVTST